MYVDNTPGVGRSAMHRRSHAGGHWVRNQQMARALQVVASKCIGLYWQKPLGLASKNPEPGLPTPCQHMPMQWTMQVGRPPLWSLKLFCVGMVLANLTLVFAG